MTKREQSIEETSLEAHVRICSERYKNLDERLNERYASLDYKLDVVDAKFANLEKKIGDLCLAVETVKLGINSDKNRGFVYIIGLLLAILGFFLVKYFNHQI